MACKNKVHYDCVTRIGETFVGHKYAFSYDVGEPQVTDLEVQFYHPHFGKIEDLLFNVANGGIVQNGNSWDMQNKVVTGIEPGAYTYKVKVTYSDGVVETIIEGFKTFES